MFWTLAAGLSRPIGKLTPDGRVVGMDVSDEMIRVARQTSLDHHNLQFITGDVAAIPQQASLFTQAISVVSAYYGPELPPLRGKFTAYFAPEGRREF